jgi:hypothetical protein
MADSPKTVPKQGNVVKRLGLGAGVLLVLLIVAYFVGTSGAFIKSVILPRVGKSMNATITADDISLSPFSSVSIKGLKVLTQGDIPLLTATEIQARYSLMDILGGKLTLHEVRVESPTIQIVPTADGKDNLAPLLNNPAPAKPTAESKPAMKLNIHQLSVNNGSFRHVAAAAKGPSPSIAATGLSLKIDPLVTGQPGRLDFSSDLTMDGGTNGAWNGKVQSQLELTLDEASFPQLLKGAVRAAIAQASGQFANLNGFSTALELDVTATDVKQVALRFEQGGKSLGSATLAGPFNAAKQEGKLKLQVAGVDRQLLGSLTAGSGLDWGNTTFTAQSDLDISKGGQAFQASGSVGVNRFSATQQGRTTPPMDLNLVFGVAADRAAQSATISSLRLQGQQNGRALIAGDLTSPMALAWGSTAAASAGDATWQVSVTDLNLSDWRAFLGDAISSGRLTSKAAIAAQNGGKVLRVDTQTGIQDLSLTLGTNGFRQGDLQLQIKAQLSDFQRLAVDQLNVKLTQAGKPAMSVNATASWDNAQGDFSAKATTEWFARRLLGSGGTKPGQMSLTAEGSLSPSSVLELKRLALGFPATTNAATNELLVQGRLDSSSPSAQKGTFTLQSTSLDLTPLYEAMTDPAAVKPAPPETASSGLPRVEPEPSTLPFKPLSVELNLAKVFLGEVTLAGAKGSLVIDGGRIKLNGLQCVLNGSPVRISADLDQGIKGTSYDLSCQLDGVPLEPLVNTFSPDLRGQVNGNLVANAQIKGAGVTGIQLRQNLAAQISANITNANIHVIQGSHKLWFLPLDVNLIASLLNIPEITRSPIQLIDLRAAASNGRINLEQATVQGSAFMAKASGGVQIADITDQSPVQIPLQISLSRAVAQKANLMNSDTPTNAAYVALPQFAALSGTLGKVETKTDKMQILQLTARAATGLLGGAPANVIQGVGNAVNNLGDGLGNLLGGRKPAGTNTPSGTNAQPSNLNPLNLFKKKPN